MLNHDDRLSDSEKFVIIIQKYSAEYETQKGLAEEMGIPKQSISDWKKNSRNIRIKNRNSISKRFQLNDMVWIDSFDDAVNFEESLENYKIKKKMQDEREKNRVTLISQIVMSPTHEVTQEEQALLDRLSQKEDIFLGDDELDEMSSASLFALAKVFKTKNKIDEALQLLKRIKKNEGSFKYNYHNQINHLKAILLSHESVQKWEKSIDILRLLYVHNYYIEEPEIITLLASNYKRKALYSKKEDKKWMSREEIDLNLLSSALILYREAYEAKEGESRYYDAINFAYLYNIADVIEMESSSGVELKTMYQELMVDWKVDLSSWWEVSSHAEFLLLIGQVDVAILNITTFLEEHVVEKFEIETTLRQLELYLHFTNDGDAEKFYTYLEESWRYLK